jgi:putative chitinase
MSLTNPPAFFDALRKGLLGPTLTAEEVKGCNAILEAMEGAPLSWTAYALATAFHETASTMQPVKEYGGPSYLTRMYDVTGARPKLALANGNTCAGDGIKYCGRGYPQLTWKNGYARATKELQKLGFNVDLVAYPDLAMRPDIAAHHAAGHGTRVVHREVVFFIFASHRARHQRSIRSRSLHHKWIRQSPANRGSRQRV